MSMRFRLDTDSVQIVDKAAAQYSLLQASLNCSLTTEALAGARVLVVFLTLNGDLSGIFFASFIDFIYLFYSTNCLTERFRQGLQTRLVGQRDRVRVRFAALELCRSSSCTANSATHMPRLFGFGVCQACSHILDALA